MKKIKNYLKNLLSRYYCNRKDFDNLQNLDAETYDVIIINSNRTWAISVACRVFYLDEDKDQLETHFAFLAAVTLVLILGPKLQIKFLYK